MLVVLAVLDTAAADCLLTSVLQHDLSRVSLDFRYTPVLDHTHFRPQYSL